MKLILISLKSISLFIAALALSYLFMWFVALWFGYQGSPIDMFKEPMHNNMGFFFAKLLSLVASIGTTSVLISEALEMIE